MTRARVRKPGGPWRVVFEGQSMNNHPTAGEGSGKYPDVCMSGRKIPYVVTAIDGFGWTFLTPSFTTRVAPQLGHEDKEVLMLCGGQTDIWGDASAATIYSRVGSYADTARAAGFDKVITQTLTPNQANTSGQNTVRLALNVLLKADAGHHFDAIIDVDSITELQDFTNMTYYLSGGVHWARAGAKLVGDMTATALNSILV